MDFERAVPSGADRAAAERIYIEAFPPSLRVPFAELVAPSAARWWLLARDRGETLGFAVVLHVGAAECVLLEYLAVRDDARNGGIGGALVERVAAEAAANGASHLLIEAEPEDSHDEFAARRLAFYARHSALPHPCVAVYAVPDQDGADGTTDLVLLHRTLRPDAAALRGELLKSALTAAWTRSYGVTPDNALLGRVLEGLTC